MEKTITSANFTLRLPADAHEMLKELAFQDVFSKTAMVEVLIRRAHLEMQRKLHTGEVVAKKRTE